MIVSRTLQSASNFYLSKNIFLLQSQKDAAPESPEKEKLCETYVSTQPFSLFD
jgi:hypothetical protein